MAKRFKLKISRIFQSCRSKDPSDLPSNPVPSFFRLSSVNPNPVAITRRLPPPTSKPHHSSLKRHVSSAFSSISYGLGSPFSSENDRSESPPPPTPEFHWEKEDRWHVIAKVYDNEKADALFPPPPPSTEKKKGRYKRRKAASKIRISTSSAYSEIFSSESFDDDDDDVNDEETETLVSSSRSISTDSSSEFNPNLESMCETMAVRHKRKKKNRKLHKAKRKVPKERKSTRLTSSESESPARLSSFLQRMIPCTVEYGKVRESYAVVKKSADPYEDFKRSMMEMILEKQIFEEKDLEQLLHCFLSLNSRQHHGVIVQAFSEIWEALFSSRSSSFRVSCALN